MAERIDEVRIKPAKNASGGKSYTVAHSCRNDPPVKGDHGPVSYIPDKPPVVCNDRKQMHDHVDKLFDDDEKRQTPLDLTGKKK